MCGQGLTGKGQKSHLTPSLVDRKLPPLEI